MKFPTISVIGVLCAGLLTFFSGCASNNVERPGYNRMTGRATPQGLPVKEGYKDKGAISYYGKGFHGKKTASGEIFNQHDLTAAHRTLPFDTRLKVTLVSTGKSVIVRVNDRGPFKKGRILDVSLAAAQALGLISSGVGQAEIEVQ